MQAATIDRTQCITPPEVVEVGRFSSVFWSTGYTHEMVIRPNFLPSRVFYRRVKKRGFLSSLKGKFNMFLDQESRFHNVAATANRKSRRMAAKGVAVVSVLAASINSASAAVDAGVTTAIANAGTDGATIGGAVLAVIVGISAFKYLRRAL